ncbi:hypothetical protein ACLK19_07335 [Escherichia coli]
MHKPISWLAEGASEQVDLSAVRRHFIECVQNQTVPQTAGEQAFMAQRIILTVAMR